MNIKNTRVKRQTRIRKKISSVSDRARLSVYRSNKYMYAQIFDTKGDALLGMSERELVKAVSKEAKGKDVLKPIERAKELGNAIAKKAISKKINEVVFDKGRFSYHGRVAAVAEGAREGGLKF